MPAKQRQISLFGPSQKTISLPINKEHPMVRLADTLDWDTLIEIAEERRALMITTNAGVKPHLRANVGAVVVRSMKSCDLRTAEDLICNYLPARYACDLHNSNWTPDFRTLWDFEEMLGSKGMAQINEYVLKTAHEKGFADIKGLCSDTTAQEARIPYPNEVGLMSTFARSVAAAMGHMGKKLGGMAKTIIKKIAKIKKGARHYRLFSKTKPSKNKVAGKMLKQSKKLGKAIKQALESMSGHSTSQLQGPQKKAHAQLLHLNGVFEKLAPQIRHWLTTGKVARHKIISMFNMDLRSIVRGKIGKPVEFGLKWGVNRIRGGYISLFLVSSAAGEASCALKGVEEHIRIFGESPKEFGYDRGGWSEPHIEKIKTLGVKRVAVAPKGKASWKVSNRCRSRMIVERAQVEGVIGTIKNYEFNKPNARKTASMERAARRSELRFNLTRMLKDLAGAAKSGAPA
jgi:hypothetical protein